MQPQLIQVLYTNSDDNARLRVNRVNMIPNNSNTYKRWLTTREVATFAILAALMFLSTLAMAAIPNVHLLGLLIGSYSLVYKKKALIPLYIFILLQGVYMGFSFFWLPYLYIWLPLWFVFYKLSDVKLSQNVRVPLYMSACVIHGLLFGIMYAPAQMLMFGLSFQGIVAWVIAGFPFDIMHGIGNLASSLLIVPLVSILKRMNV